MEYLINSISFSGPLDLLLELIKKNKFEIKDILIVDLINQYLEYIKEIEKHGIEIASDFISMASTLIEIKSRYLIFLNDTKEEEDPGKDLILLLEKYKKYKDLSEIIKNKYENTLPLYTNMPFEIFTEETLDLSKFNLVDLKKAYMGLMKNTIEVKPSMISFKKISIDDKIKEIEKILLENTNILFQKILLSNEKEEVVATLLGVLELSKEQRVDIIQKKNFHDILIERLYEI